MRPLHSCLKVTDDGDMGMCCPCLLSTLHEFIPYQL